MRRICILIALLMPLMASAQNAKILSATKDTIPAADGRSTSHMNLEFVTSANAYLTEGRFDEAAFKLNRVRLEIFGRLNQHLSYHFRQSFNKYSNPHSVNNLSSSIEYANIKWHHSDLFEVVAGKQFVNLAGYEGYLNALEVREFCNFNENVSVYQAGVMGVLHPNKNNDVSLQVTNIRSGSDSDQYIYGLPEGVEPSKVPVLATLNWNGWFADKALHLMYSASAGQQAKNRNIST